MSQISGYYSTLKEICQNPTPDCGKYLVAVLFLLGNEYSKESVLKRNEADIEGILPVLRLLSTVELKNPIEKFEHQECSFVALRLLNSLFNINVNQKIQQEIVECEIRIWYHHTQEECISRIVLCDLYDRQQIVRSLSIDMIMLLGRCCFYTMEAQEMIPESPANRILLLCFNQLVQLVKNEDFVEDIVSDTKLSILTEVVTHFIDNDEVVLYYAIMLKILSSYSNLRPRLVNTIKCETVINILQRSSLRVNESSTMLNIVQMLYMYFLHVFSDNVATADVNNASDEVFCPDYVRCLTKFTFSALYTSDMFPSIRKRSVIDSPENRASVVLRAVPTNKSRAPGALETVTATTASSNNSTPNSEPTDAQLIEFVTTLLATVVFNYPIPWILSESVVRTLCSVMDSIADVKVMFFTHQLLYFIIHTDKSLISSLMMPENSKPLIAILTRFPSDWLMGVMQMAVNASPDFVDTLNGLSLPSICIRIINQNFESSLNLINTSATTTGVSSESSSSLRLGSMSPVDESEEGASERSEMGMAHGAIDRLRCVTLNVLTAYFTGGMCIVLPDCSVINSLIHLIQTHMSRSSAMAVRICMLCAKLLFEITLDDRNLRYFQDDNVYITEICKILNEHLLKRPVVNTLINILTQLACHGDAQAILGDAFFNKSVRHVTSELTVPTIDTSSDSFVQTIVNFTHVFYVAIKNSTNKMLGLGEALSFMRLVLQFNKSELASKEVLDSYNILLNSNNEGYSSRVKKDGKIALTVLLSNPNISESLRHDAQSIMDLLGR